MIEDMRPDETEVICDECGLLDEFCDCCELCGKMVCDEDCEAAEEFW